MFLTKASRYGLYALAQMARAPDDRIKAGDVATSFDISENHVAKVLQQLSRAGLVTSSRGASGGYQLARDPAEITMLEVVEILEGALTTGSPGQDGEGTAHAVRLAIHTVLAELNTTAYYTLKSVTLATLARDEDAIVQLTG